ncbi:MAG: 4Fe-4S dicluster domain-containing protein [Stellaceae bacterium]
MNFHRSYRPSGIPDNARDPATGWVDLDDHKCIGCKMCVAACPFGNSLWDELTHKILKCDYCGGDPACAKFCPTHAIDWVDDLVATRTRKRAFTARWIYVGFRQRKSISTPGCYRRAMWQP